MLEIRNRNILLRWNLRVASAFDFLKVRINFKLFPLLDQSAGAATILMIHSDNPNIQTAIELPISAYLNSKHGLEGFRSLTDQDKISEEVR